MAGKGGDVEWVQIQVVLVGSARLNPVLKVLPDGVQTLTADVTGHSTSPGGLSHSELPEGATQRQLPEPVVLCVDDSGK